MDIFKSLVWGVPALSLLCCLALFNLNGVQASHHVFLHLQSKSKPLLDVNQQHRPAYHFQPPKHWINGNEDGWNWTAAPDDKYTTRSAYFDIKSRRSECQSQNADAKSLASVWTTPAPHKALVTAWRILRNRLPTCDNLSKRNISLGDGERECPHCHEHGESTNHLFTSCAKTQEIWNKIQQWIGVSSARPYTTGLHWKIFCYCGKNKKVSKLLRMIWVGCCWILWKKRNDKKFEGKDWEVEDLILELKARTWCWNRIFGVVDKDVDFSLWSSDDLIHRCL